MFNVDNNEVRLYSALGFGLLAAWAGFLTPAFATGLIFGVVLPTTFTLEKIKNIGDELRVR